MKIACLIHSLDGGGAERVMASLASRLAARQHEVTLITLDDGSGDRHSIDSLVARRTLDVMSQSHNLWDKVVNTRRRTRVVRDAIREVAPDVVLSFCDRTNILTLMATKKLGIPVVVSERSDPSQQTLSTVWEWMRGRAYRRADVVVALTEASASHLRERFSGNSVVVIPSAVDVPPFESDREVAIGNRRILGIGRLEHEKGFDRLIDAFASIAATDPDWSLRILGEGPRRAALEQHARELGLADRVTLPGWVRPVWEELSATTIFALPSRYEGFPSALLEAMAIGVPSVAVDCESGPRAVLDGNECGLLVSNDLDGLAAGLRQLMEDADARERMGEAGKRVVDRFSWDAMVDGYEQVLLKALARSASE